MRQAKIDLAEQIFSATDRLMAREGLNQLSMHKLAKEANVAAGTIYLYFKNKDELLEQFAHRVFSMFGLLAELSEDILFLLSLKTAINLASDAKFIDLDLKPEILESVTERSWRAIQK